MARIANLDITIAPNGIARIPVRGSYLYILSATTDFKIRVNNEETLDARQDFILDEEKEWQELEFQNITEADLTVNFYYGDGRARINSVSLTGEMKLAQATNRAHSVVTVGTAAIKLLDSDLNRKGWKVVNNGTDTIYLGSDNTVTTANGEPLAAGAATGWDDRDALYAISGTAGQDIRVTEII